MRKTLRATLIAFLGLVAASQAFAETRFIEVSIAFRERMALPPDAEVDVQLLRDAQDDPATRRIAAQRFRMDAVPQTVRLAYDPNLISSTESYSVAATIWSQGRPLFQTDAARAVLGPSDATSVQIMLTRAAEEPPLVPRGLSGVRWTVTEIAGQPWDGDEPATLVFDRNMTVALFAGCNRMSGRAILTDNTLHFPSDIAITMMACPPDVEAREQAFLAALRRVTGHVRYGTGLVLTGADGRAVMHLDDPGE